MSMALNCSLFSVQAIKMAVDGVIIDIAAIDLIAFCSKERLLSIMFKSNDVRSKKVMIDQQRSKQHAEVDQ